MSTDNSNPRLYRTAMWLIFIPLVAVMGWGCQQGSIPAPQNSPHDSMLRMAEGQTAASVAPHWVFSPDSDFEQLGADFRLSHQRDESLRYGFEAHGGRWGYGGTDNETVVGGRGFVGWTERPSWASNDRLGLGWMPLFVSAGALRTNSGHRYIDAGVTMSPNFSLADETLIIGYSSGFGSWVRVTDRYDAVADHTRVGFVFSGMVSILLDLDPVYIAAEAGLSLQFYILHDSQVRSGMSAGIRF